MVDDPVAVGARQDDLPDDALHGRGADPGRSCRGDARGEIIAAGAPDQLGGRDLRPAEIRFGLPAGWSLDDLPDVPAQSRALEGDRVVVQSIEPVVAVQRITTWALERQVALAHFSVTQPTLEDIYLELTRPQQDRAMIEPRA